MPPRLRTRAMTRVFSTRQVSAADGFAYWREIICDVFVQLDAEPIGAGEFLGSISTTDVGPVTVSSVDARRHHVARSPRQIAKAAREDFLVSVQMSGLVSPLKTAGKLGSLPETSFSTTPPAPTIFTSTTRSSRSSCRCHVPPWTIAVSGSTASPESVSPVSHRWGESSTTSPHRSPRTPPNSTTTLHTVLARQRSISSLSHSQTHSDGRRRRHRAPFAPCTCGESRATSRATSPTPPSHPARSREQHISQSATSTSSSAQRERASRAGYNNVASRGAAPS